MFLHFDGVCKNAFAKIEIGDYDKKSKTGRMKKKINKIK